MRYSVALPNDRFDAAEQFLVAEAVGALSQGFEESGFDACFVTDHPFATDRWLAAGGHHASDPFVLLGVAAASTSRLKLHTHSAVLPYRNPFLLAKSVLTLDVLSRGRVILGVAAGYLKGEFGALGVDFDERNELVSEALEAVKLALTTDGVVFEGRHFTAGGNTMRPRPSAAPYPPIWMGGNSKLAIRRAVEHCDGWSPLPTRPGATVRTAQITTMGELAERIAYVHAFSSSVGRTTPLEICLGLLDPAPGDSEYGPKAAREQLKALSDLGVTWVAVRPEADQRDTYLTLARRFADDVIDPLR